MWEWARAHGQGANRPGQGLWEGVCITNGERLRQSLGGVGYELKTPVERPYWSPAWSPTVGEGLLLSFSSLEYL